MYFYITFSCLHRTMRKIYLDVPLHRTTRQDIAVYCGQFNTQAPNSFFIYISVGSLGYIKLVLSLNAHANVPWYSISVRAHSHDNPRIIMPTWSSRKSSYVLYNESYCVYKSRSSGTRWFLFHGRQERQETFFERETRWSALSLSTDEANEKRVSSLKILPQSWRGKNSEGESFYFDDK